MRIALLVLLAFGWAAAPAAGAELVADTHGLTLIEADGSRVTLGDDHLGSPDWSPDGTRVVAVDRSRAGGRLVVVDVATRAVTPVPGGEGLDTPDWSPDGSAFAAVRETRGARGPRRMELVVLPSGGGTPRVLASGEWYTGPDWSPDGRRIAFTTGGPSSDRRRDVLTVEADGSSLRVLLAEAEELAWSPDGARIAFVRDRDIHIAAADGSGARPVGPRLGADVTPAWSPDGTRLAFGSSRHADGGLELFTMDPDGSCVTQVTWSPGAAFSPAWRPGSTAPFRGPCGGRLVPYHDTVDLRVLRSPGTVPLFPGRSFADNWIVHAETDAYPIVLYGECGAADPKRCLSGLDIRTYTTCAQSPPRFYAGHVTRVRRIRGALVIEYEHVVEVLSGGTTTEASGLPEALVTDFVNALRPVHGPPRLDRPLPAPRLSAAAMRRLRRLARRGEKARESRRILRVVETFGPRRRPACERPRPSAR